MCGLQDLGSVADLLNQYRVFYELPDDLGTSRAFIRANLQDQRSRIFLDLNDEDERWPSPSSSSPSAPWP